MMKKNKPFWQWSASDLTQAIRNELLTSWSMNILGLPAAIAPMGLHEGVPHGIQIVGRCYREDMVLDAAGAIEARVGLLPEKLW